MKILVYGAGVLGTLYAARLQEAGHNVSILARGQRLADIREYGLVLEHVLTGKRTITDVNVVERFGPKDAYDLAVVLIRKNQVSAILPILATNKETPNILFMVNNPLGYDEWVNAVGRKRLVLGFSGAGGTLEGYTVRYIVVSSMLQPTTFGELDGQTTLRLKAIVWAFKDAGFPVAISPDMDAWQKCHIAWISPISSAIYMAGGDNYRLARLPNIVRLMVRTIREGFQVLRALGVPITPAKLKLWEWIPEPILVALVRLWANTHYFEIVATKHSNAARDEMQQLVDEFKMLARNTSVATPAMDRLSIYVNPTDRSIAEGIVTILNSKMGD